MPTIQNSLFSCKPAGRQVEILTQRFVMSGIGDDRALYQDEYECGQAGMCPLHAQPTCPVNLVNRWRQNGGGLAG